jgi:transcriptional regulator with XRE-family HTH domain
MTQDELAALTGIHKTAISKYENDRIKPGICTLVKISDVLGVSLNTLVKG